MDTLGFLQRVLPSEGYYVSIVVNPDGRKQGFFQTVEELATACTRLDKAGNNTYFAISSFCTKENRKQENVNKTKVIAIDVDCGNNKPFADWKEGLKALQDYIVRMKLPKPMVVGSGNGLHVYWVLTKELEPDDWKPIANAVKASALDKGFKADAGLIANSSLVLRPIGTHNPKNGKEVKLLIDADPVTPEELSARLHDYVLSTGPLQSRQTSDNSLLNNLSATVEFPPSISASIYNKCQQVKYAVDNQDSVTEPVWYNAIGIAAYCIDPEDTARRWSENYPAYSEEATMSKLRHWKDGATGPTTCAKFDVDNPDGCKGCKYKGKITSPIRLGVSYQEVQLQETLYKNASQVQLPKPFKRTKDGIKITIDDTDIDVCRFDIYPVSYGKDESLGYETVRYHWKRPHVGWQELVLRQAYLTEGHREFATAIADQGIVLYNKKQTEFFQLMLRTYMDELRQIRSMSNLYASMGWKENNTQFVRGNTLFRSSGGEVTKDTISLTSASNKTSQDLYSTKGTVQNWVELTNLLEKAGMPWHMFALGIGFSAPLYNFTGLKGLTISLYGPTGGGKTLAQYWVQSIYGDPEKLHFTAKYTQNSLFSRLGLYSNLPLTVDEVTMMQDREVGDFCYWVSQGRDKARLNRNAEERDAKTWATPVIVSTNKSLQSKLIASGLETDAQMARLLEIPIPPHRLFTKDSSTGRKIYNLINSNYGEVGQVYINKLMELGSDVIQGMIEQATNDFQGKYKSKFTGEERYWEQAIILADLGLKLADDWNLIKFDYRIATEWVLAQLGAIRRTVQDNKVDAFDLIAEYLNDSAGAAVTVMHTSSNKPTVDLSRMPRADIRVRFDIYRNSEVEEFDRGTILIDRTHFRKWLSVRGADYKSFTQELAEENVVATPKSQKAYLGKDTPVKLGQTYVIGVNLNHPRLMGILDAVESNVDDLTQGKFKLV